MALDIKTDPRLRIDFCGLDFATPLVLLSGCVGFGEEYTRIQGFSNREAGAICLKGTTLAPRLGNAPHRLCETLAGMINAIGLPGPGLDAFVAHELPRLLALPCPLILSIGGFSSDDYVLLAAGLREALDRAVPTGWTARVGLELNISCPNVHSGCASIGADAGETEAVVGAARAAWPGLLVAK
ncbi:MAG: dihydroorotate dehydrogenase, partial [Chromatiaceae bacterium]